MAESVTRLPTFSSPLYKNDAAFLLGASENIPWVYAHEQSTTEVVHGPSCKREKEIFEDTCAKEGVPIIRRRGGGGTVVLCPGVVVLLVVLPRSPDEDALSVFRRIHSPLCSLFQDHYQLNLTQSGISDLALENKKVLGSSLYLGKKPFLAYYQSALLVDADLTLLSRYLQEPLRQPEYRKKRTHADFCTNLAASVPDITSGSVVSLLNSQLRTLLSV